MKDRKDIVTSWNIIEKDKVTSQNIIENDIGYQLGRSRVYDKGGNLSLYQERIKIKEYQWKYRERWIEKNTNWKIYKDR